MPTTAVADWGPAVPDEAVTAVPQKDAVLVTLWLFGEAVRRWAILSPSPSGPISIHADVVVSSHRPEGFAHGSPGPWLGDSSHVLHQPGPATTGGRAGEVTALGHTVNGGQGSTASDLSLLTT